MIRSMTGFGAAEGVCDTRLYAVEARSVNHRYLKTSYRYPEEFAFVEPLLEGVLRQRLTRGAVTLRVFVRQPADAATRSLNFPLLAAYLQELQRAAEGLPSVRIDAATAAGLPGVMEPGDLDESERQRASDKITELANAALDQLLAAREREGATIAADLDAQLAVLGAGRAVVSERAPTVVSDFQQRLHARVQQLLNSSGVELAQDDLLKEVSLFAERSDINEELQRLGAHLDSFAAAMRAPEPAGRRLDFIAQELLREVNTIGSKANDATIAQRVIDMKTAIDRIKEQVQNVE